MEVVTLGETMVQLNATTSGPLRYVHTFEKHCAGTESNFAIGTVRMGLTAGWLSRVGDDEFGRYVLSQVRGEGVDVSRVIVDPDAPTGVYFIQRDYPVPGQSATFYYRQGSAASRLRIEDVDAAYITDAKLLHLTGITPALSVGCRRAWYHAAELARNNDVTLSFDTNLRLKLWSPRRAREALRRMLGLCDVLITDPDDAATLLGQTDPKAAAAFLLERGPSIVVMKLGDRGGFVMDAEGTLVERQGFDVPVVDTVGAGDAFDAGFLSGLLRDWDLNRCLEVANAAGALCVTVRGDVEALPTLRDVDQFLSNRKRILR